MGFWSRRRRQRSNGSPPLVDIWLQPFPVDVSDRGDEFVLAAVAPGLDREAFHVAFTDDETVEIGADFTDLEDDDRGAESREIRLPEPVLPADAEASYQEHILELTLPKQRPGEPQ